MTQRIAAILTTVSILLLTSFDLPAISINVLGGWSLVIDSGDVIAGAGGDLTSQYLSNADAITINVADAIDDSDNWQIQVRKEDTLWHAALTLSILRTSDGAGTGTISGGNSLFLDLTAVDQFFFDGAGNRSIVDLQLRLSGVSVLIPSDNYSTVIYYTVIDTP